MKSRNLGKQGLQVPCLGLGCMGMSWAYGKADDKESLHVLDHALELGINFWDTAELYGPFKNEELLGAALKNKARDKIIVATKFAFRFNEKGEQIGLDSSPAHIKKAIEGSLKRLATDYIDLYYQHRLDPNTPIEDTMGALADLVTAGKVRYLGLSEVGSETIRRAHSVFPVTAVQSEYSLWERGIEENVLPMLRELGIGCVAYSPIGRGFLTGKINNLDQMDTNDRRRDQPRFQDGNLEHNLKLVEIIKNIAADNHTTPAQIALAWLLKQGDDIVPIPGTKQIKYLEENAKAANVELSAAAWEALNTAIANFTTAGNRYSPALMKGIDMK